MRACGQSTPLTRLTVSVRQTLLQKSTVVKSIFAPRDMALIPERVKNARIRQVTHCPFECLRITRQNPDESAAVMDRTTAALNRLSRSKSTRLLFWNLRLRIRLYCCFDHSAHTITSSAEIVGDRSERDCCYI